MKILLIRFSSIGDIVLCSPIMRCLKDQFPEHELHFLCKSSYASLIEYNPHLSKVHRWQEEYKDELISTLKAEKFDLVLDMHKNLRSKSVISKLGVRSLSFDKLNVKKWLFSRFKINRLPTIHLVDRYFQAFASLGIANDGKGLDFYLDPSISLEQTLGELGMPKDEPYNLIAIGGTYVTKRMPAHKLAQVLDGLQRPCVLIGGPNDKEEEQKILSLTKNKSVFAACGKLSLQQSALLISKASHVYSHDSGSMHIAAAFKKPMSVVWGNTHPSFGMYPYGYSKNAPLFQYQQELKCRPCSKLGYDKCPKSHFNCMELQNVGEIVKNWESTELAQ